MFSVISGIPSKSAWQKESSDNGLSMGLNIICPTEGKGVFLLLINLRVIGCWPHGHLKVEFSVSLRDILNKYCFYQNNQMLSALSIP